MHLLPFKPTHHVQHLLFFQLSKKSPTSTPCICIVRTSLSTAVFLSRSAWSLALYFSASIGVTVSRKWRTPDLMRAMVEMYSEWVDLILCWSWGVWPRMSNLDEGDWTMDSNLNLAESSCNNKDATLCYQTIEQSNLKKIYLLFSHLQPSLILHPIHRIRRQRAVEVGARIVVGA